MQSIHSDDLTSATDSFRRVLNNLAILQVRKLQGATELSSVTGILNIFEQNEGTIYLFICTEVIILKHQEKEIHQVLKDEQVMVCSIPF